MSTDKDDKFLPSPAIQRGAPQHPLSLIISAIAFYWVASLSVVFLNKTILSGSEYKFPYPLFVTLYQLIVALVLLVVCGQLGKRYEKDLSLDANNGASATLPVKFSTKKAKEK